MTYSKHRIEALSDGVFAIAMTLLILDLKVPLDVAPGQLGPALRQDSSQWFSFFITFALTSVFWTLQHRVFDAIERMDGRSLRLTFLFLGFVSVLPFSTSLWGHHMREPLAFMLYFLNQLALAVVLTAKLELARAARSLKLGPEADAVRLRLYLMCVVMAVGAVATQVLPVVWVWVPVLGVGAATNAFRRWRERRLIPPSAT